MSHTESTGRSGGSRRRLLRVLGAATLVCAALVAPAIARADVRTANVTLGSPVVTPNPPFQGGFGIYNFTVSDVTPNAQLPVRRQARSRATASSSRRRRAPRRSPSAPRLTSRAPSRANAARIQWLLESSAAKSPGSAIQAAAHQSAIWQITNPGPGGVLTDSQGRAIAAQLVADSTTYAADATNGAALDVQGGADATSCAGTTRTIVVTGTPFTTATLTITSGVGTFAAQRDDDDHGHARARRHGHRSPAEQRQQPRHDHRLGQHHGLDDGAVRRRRQAGLRLPPEPADHEDRDADLHRLPPLGLEDRRAGVQPHVHVDGAEGRHERVEGHGRRGRNGHVHLRRDRHQGPRRR